MKKLFRNALVGIFLGPLIAYAHVLSTVVGRDEAIKAIGRFLTNAAKRSLRFWMPAIERAEDFDEFAPNFALRRRYDRFY